MPVPQQHLTNKEFTKTLPRILENDGMSYVFQFIYYNKLYKKRGPAFFRFRTSNEAYDGICRDFDKNRPINPFGTDYKRINQWRKSRVQKHIDTLFSSFDGRDFDDFVSKHTYELLRIGVFNCYLLELINEWRAKTPKKRR